jgi:hypothetical protein
MDDLIASGSTATMSMPANSRKWLWEALDYGCGIDSGRTAVVPGTNLLVNSFKVMSETGNLHQIKTICTGFDIQFPKLTEYLIVRIFDSRYHSTPTSVHLL